MLSYKDTWLWRRAFVESRKDASKDEQEFFETQYYSMRERASYLLEQCLTSITLSAWRQL